MTRELSLGMRVFYVPKAVEPENKVVALVTNVTGSSATLACFHRGGRMWPQFDVPLSAYTQRGLHNGYWEPLPNGLE